MGEGVSGSGKLDCTHFSCTMSAYSRPSPRALRKNRPLAAQLNSPFGDSCFSTKKRTFYSSCDCDWRHMIAVTMNKTTNVKSYTRRNQLTNISQTSIRKTVPRERKTETNNLQTLEKIEENLSGNLW